MGFPLSNQNYQNLHLSLFLGKNKNFVNFIKKSDLDWVFIATPNSTLSNCKKMFGIKNQRIL